MYCSCRQWKYATHLESFEKWRHPWSENSRQAQPCAHHDSEEDHAPLLSHMSNRNLANQIGGSAAPDHHWILLIILVVLRKKYISCFTVKSHFRPWMVRAKWCRPKKSSDEGNHVTDQYPDNLNICIVDAKEFRGEMASLHVFAFYSTSSFVGWPG